MKQNDSLKEMNDAFVEVSFKEVSGDKVDPVPDLKDPSKNKDEVYKEWEVS
jgi:hypothetical protein